MRKMCSNSRKDIISFVTDNKIALFFLLAVASIFLSCSSKNGEKKWILLSDIPYGHIYNDFGSPRRNSSYHFTPIKIADNVYENGLGFHAPGNLKIKLDGRVSFFEASIGLDKESVWLRKSKQSGLNKEVFDSLYAGKQGSVRFFIVADDDTIFKSDPFFEDTPAQKIKFDVEDVQQLTLICDNAGDGYFADIADWADAKLLTNKKYSAGDFQIRYYRDDILVNHSGYLPQSSKYCVVPGKTDSVFEVVEEQTNKIAYHGTFEFMESDMGIWSKGNFSGLKKEGKYFIRTNRIQSYVFEIDQSLYLKNIEKHLNFIKEQRSGDLNNGRSKGQHLDDGIRPDNKLWIDAVGGWYDAADLRKAPFIDIINLFALAEIYKDSCMDALNAAILEEIRWGNQLFLKLQDSSGYMMYSIGFNGVGQANPEEGERNYNTYTDNIKGTRDDRPIQINPSMIVAQMLFVISELKVADIFDRKDKEYADLCRASAIHCFDWSLKNQKCITSYDYGAGVSAAIELFKTTSDSLYFGIALDYTRKLLTLQEKINPPVNGWFNTWHDKPELAVPLNYLNWHLFGLCDFAEAFPTHSLADRVEIAIVNYSASYLLRIAGMNPFNLLPYGVFRNDEGGGRKIGDFYFRYGVQNNYDDEWWNGINSDIAAQGYGLVRAAKILDKPKYLSVAQSQLDWIYGCNPFNASTVTGIGYNQPDWFKTEEFYPAVPQIAGAVMAGIGTDQMDEFVLNPGTWNTTEYWLPPTAYTMLLLNALNQASIE